MAICRVNTNAAKLTVIGWFAGLAWFWWSGGILSTENWLILIVGGMFAVSLIVGGSVAIIMGMVARLVYGDRYGKVDFYTLGKFISPIIAFLSAPLVAYFFI